MNKRPVSPSTTTTPTTPTRHRSDSPSSRCVDDGTSLPFVSPGAEVDDHGVLNLSGHGGVELLEDSRYVCIYLFIYLCLFAFFYVHTKPY
jgi:hypothetical protein